MKQVHQKLAISLILDTPLKFSTPQHIRNDERSQLVVAKVQNKLEQKKYVYLIWNKSLIKSIKTEIYQQLHILPQNYASALLYKIIQSFYNIHENSTRKRCIMNRLYLYT